MTSNHCTTHTWCTETDPHTTHASPYIEVPTPDGYGDHILPANLMGEDGPNGFAPFVGFLDLDLTPAQTRERVTELRRHLDQVMALADQLDGEAPLEPAAETYTVTAPGAGGALLNAEIYTTDDPQPGSRSRIAVYGLPGSDAELDVAGADQLLGELEGFIPRFRALRDHLATLTRDTEPEVRP